MQLWIKQFSIRKAFHATPKVTAVSVLVLAVIRYMRVASACANSTTVVSAGAARRLRVYLLPPVATTRASISGLPLSCFASLHISNKLRRAAGVTAAFEQLNY